MLPILNIGIQSLVLRHAQEVIKYLNSNSSELPFSQFEDWVIQAFNGKYSVQELLVAKPLQLQEIVRAFSNSNLTVLGVKDLLLVYKRFSNKTENLNNSGGGYGAYNLLQSLQLSTCPLCGIEPLIYSSPKGRQLFQFVHFFDSDKYPFLSLSFFNLIPACRTCKQLKDNNDLDVSPYALSFDSDLLPQLSVKLKDASFYHQPDSLTIEIKNVGSNDKVLKLSERYEPYSKQVNDLIKQLCAYSDEYIAFLWNSYKGLLFSSPEHIKNMVRPSSKVENIDFPLSKFDSNIVAQFELY